MTRATPILSAIVCSFLLFLGVQVAGARTYYVSLSGSDDNDGTAPNKPWRTVSYAATQAKPGDTVHIQGGNYGRDAVVIKNSGIAGQPIVFQGYKDIPGDTPGADGMPLLDGNYEKANENGIFIARKSYITINNVAITGFQYGVYGAYEGTHHITLRNIRAYLNSGSGIVFNWAHDILIKGCVAYNNQMADFSLGHSTRNSLIEGCLSFNVDEKELGGIYTTDYNYAISDGATHNTIKDCIAGKLPAEGGVGSGHGYACRRNASHNKVINCRSFYNNCEHYKVSEDSDHNEFINCIGVGMVPERYVAGFNIKSSHNRVINCVAADVYYGILVYWSRAEPSRRPLTGNVFKNNIVANTKRGIHFSEDGVDTEENVIKYNNVWGSEYSNYSNCSAGIGDMSRDPLFVSQANHDYHLRSKYGRRDGGKWINDQVSSPCIDGGDPTDGCSDEPQPNGGRRNMGAYGNTGEASKSMQDSTGSKKPK